MSKKKLLEEGTVRQFMKLANLKPLASGFINEMGYGMHEDEVEEGLYEQEDEMEDEMLPPEPEDAAMDMMADKEEAPMDMDMDAEEGAEGALAGVDSETVEALVTAITTALEDATGVDIAVTGDEEGMAGEEEMDFAPAEEAPEGEEEEEVMEMAHPEGEMEEGMGMKHSEEEMMEDIDLVDEEAIMQETYRRVAKRLGAMNKQHKLVESVTNRIMSRLNKSK
tara:strand:+ start:448 stop:1116 length:669 start_codon:yes stop_codon:yes gene_type:complete